MGKLSIFILMITWACSTPPTESKSDKASKKEATSNNTGADKSDADLSGQAGDEKDADLESCQNGNDCNPQGEKQSDDSQDQDKDDGDDQAGDTSDQTASDNSEWKQICDTLVKTDTVCSEVYMSTKCILGKYSAKGSGLCDAKTKLHEIICKEKAFDLKKDEVRCIAEDSILPKPEILPTWQETCKKIKDNSMKVCTQEYMPTICSLGKTEVIGTNRCAAQNALESVICASEDFTLSKAEISCRPAMD